MEKTILRGYLTKILFKTDNGWAMGLFASEDDERAKVKVKGNISSLQSKVLYEIKGSYSHHPTYGPAFDVSEFREAPINSSKQTVNYLSSSLFPGIGKKAAQDIVNHFASENVWEILKLNPERIEEIESLKLTQKQLFMQKIRELQKDEKMRLIFFENELPVIILDNISKLTEDSHQMEDIFKNNFFQFALQHELGKFEQIDIVATFFGLEKASPERVGYWSWRACGNLLFDKGDSYSNEKMIMAQTKKLIKLNNDKALIDGLAYALKNNLLIKEENRIYTKESYDDELKITQCIKNGIQIEQKFSEKKINEEITIVEQEISNEKGIKDFKFDLSQRTALLTFVNNRISILTGGPGTGKTSIIEGAVKLYKNLYKHKKISIAAPTGRAAARIRESFPDSDAKTIHKLLQAENNLKFGISEDKPLDVDMLVVDECSMIENRLFSQLIQSSEKAKKILLVGDANQLPSVGYGNVFADLIQAKMIPTTFLEQIHRQNEDNDIIGFANEILNKDFELKASSDYTNIKFLWSTGEKAQRVIQSVYQDNLDEIKNNPNYLQIIAPMYAGDLGIGALNLMIQREFNPLSKNKENWYKNEFLENDKIMVTKNDYDLDLSNGDVGIIKSLKLAGKQELVSSIVNFEMQGEIGLDSANYDDVALAYTCSIHKTQGSEYKKVILVLDDVQSNSFFLNKKLLYTAITRTKEELYVIGNKDWFLYGIQKEPIKRNTTLVKRLQSN